MGSRADMRRDLRDYLADTPWREQFTTWLTYYWWPTRRWMPKVGAWWHYKILRYPPIPPLAKDRIAQHFGFHGGPPCTDGPVCAAHGWDLSPLAEEN